VTLFPNLIIRVAAYIPTQVKNRVLLRIKPVALLDFLEN
jgi:hypothetical protein